MNRLTAGADGEERKRDGWMASWMGINFEIESGYYLLDIGGGRWNGD